jgi:transcriptional regulator with GAF, ATPase, and Fis domain
VWDLLTNGRIEWKGNVRQLQAVVHNVARETKKEFSNNPNKNELDVRMMRRVLEKMKLLQKKESEDASTTYN